MQDLSDKGSQPQPGEGSQPIIWLIFPKKKWNQEILVVWACVPTPPLDLPMINICE